MGLEKSTEGKRTLDMSKKRQANICIREKDMPALKEEDTDSRASPLDLQSLAEKPRAELQLPSQSQLQLYLPPALEEERLL